MREEVLGRIVRFLDKLSYFEIVNDAQKFDDFIHGLSVDQFSNLLTTFNAILRNVPTADKGVLAEEEGRMVVDDWISPSREVQNNVLGNLLNGIKQLPDNNERAALLYYGVLDLHMFPDGNGRTARFFYDLISGNSNFMDNIDWYIHSENNWSCYEGSFEEFKGIAPIDNVNWYSSYTLPAEISKYSIELDSKIFDKSIETFGSSFVGEYNEIPISKEAEGILSKEEIRDVSYILNDSNGYYSVGGMTMLVMASKKGQLGEWIAKNDANIERVLSEYGEEDARVREQRFIFNLREENSNMFDSWTAEDYREAINVGNHFKTAQLNNMIDIFVNPNNYLFNNGRTYKSVVLPDSENKQM